MREDFAVFIITHKRYDRLHTYNTLVNCGYTGKIYLVLDNLDETVCEYRKRYDNIIVFDKQEYVRLTDTAMYEPLINFAVFSRNAVEDIARDLGYKYYLVMDDDITNLRFRWCDDGHIKSRKITHNFDYVMEKHLEFMDTANVDCLGFGNSGLYMQGVDALSRENTKMRMIASMYIRRASTVVEWRPNMLEDCVTSVEMANNGNISIISTLIQYDSVQPAATGGKTVGGNSSVYNTFDKFKQTFFPIVVRPSCFKYTNANFNKGRIMYPSVKYDNSIPKIIGGVYKNGII